MRDYYEILAVERAADGEAIKRAYRKVAMQYHPDRNGGDKEADRRDRAPRMPYAGSYTQLAPPPTLISELLG